MYLELYINNQLADIDDDTDVSLRKEYQDESDLERKTVEYSYELQLPITYRNQKIFGFADDIQVKHKFYRVYNAQLYADNLLVMDGKFMLTEISKGGYTGNLYVPSYKALSEILGEKNLNEINEELISLNTLESFYEINKGVLQDVSNDGSYVCFPYILYNYARSDFGDMNENEYVQLSEYKNSTVDFTNIYPSYNVLKVIERIFATFGYKVSGNIFNDERFKQLWMSGSFDADKYKDNLNYPQYLSLSGRYFAHLDDVETNTLQYFEKTSNNEGHRQKYYAEDILHSNATTLTPKNNTHDIFQQSGNQGSIVIRKSGWYHILLTADCDLLHGKFDSDLITSNEMTYWKNTMGELRLVKGDARSNTNWFSQFGQSPIAPRYNDTDNEALCTMAVNGQNVNMYGWSNADMPNTLRIPLNGKTAIVHNYSNFPTSDFIGGFRWGNSVDNTEALFFQEYVSAAWVMSALPNIDTNTVLTYNSENKTYSLPVSTLSQRVSGGKDLVHWEDCAVVLVSEDAFTKSEGYCTFNVTDKYTDSKGNMVAKGEWTYGNDSVYPYFIRPNGAVVRDDDNDNSAYGQMSCVVWLDEGETVNMELLTTAQWIEHTKAPNVGLGFNLEIGLISTDEDWKPNNRTNTIPYSVSANFKPQTTNINQFLPDMTCNDFLENFMTTFNLRVTRIADDEYSINYSDLRKTSLNIVPLDKYYDPDEVTQKSVDLSSEYSFKFTIDEDEEGYVSGDNSPFNTSEKKANELPEYDGSKTIVNIVNTTDDVEETESKFSYNWYKTIWWTTMDDYSKWVSDGKPDISSYGGVKCKVPVIADASVWKKSFEEGQSEGDKTNGTVRLFYLDRGSQLYITNDDGSTRMMYLVPQNSYGSLDLDYNSIPSYTGIEDMFFSTVTEASYEIYVKMALSNSDYKSIEQNSLIRINGELFRVVKIDGHDVTGEESSDVVLKAII